MDRRGRAGVWRHHGPHDAGVQHGRPCAPTTPRCVVNQCERCTGKVTLTRNKDTGVYRATHTLPDECWLARIFDPFAPQTAGLSAPR